MTTPPPPQSSAVQAADVQQDGLTAGQIAAILAAGLATQQTLSLLSRVLSPFGISAAAIRLAYGIGGRKRPLPRPDAARFRAPRGSDRLRRTGNVTVLPSATALDSTLAAEDVFRAAWIYAAAGRLQRAADQARRDGRPVTEALRVQAEAERRFHQQHVAAQTRRRQIAAQVDVAAARHGVPYRDPATGQVTRLVGWHAKLDGRTSIECRLANGLNFPANRPPSIGWPGAVHPSCRCRPGAPHAQGRLLDSIISTRRKAA